MFDIGWTELLLIGIVSLIVVGPKDLPRMFAALGRFTAKARGMAREFQRAMDDAAKESGVAETASELRTMTSKKNLGLDRIEEAAKKFESWEPVKSSSAASKSAATKTVPAPGSETAKLAEKRAADAEARRQSAAAAGSGKAANAPPAAKAAEPTSGSGMAKAVAKANAGGAEKPAASGASAKPRAARKTPAAKSAASTKTPPKAKPESGDA